ncbi:MarR family transcriptional regulator, partial [Agathobacter sp.]
MSIDESEDPCTQKRISQQWSMPKQTTNMVLKDLESKGYVELVPLPEDK